MIYNTGIIDISGNTATGTGTNWTAAASQIRVSQTIIVLSNPVQMFQITAINSGTSLTVTPVASPALSGQKYGILVTDSLSVDGLAQSMSQLINEYDENISAWETFASTSSNQTITVTINGVSLTIPAIGGLARRGVNDDITELKGLTKPLSLTQGGTGAENEEEARAKLGLTKITKPLDFTSGRVATVGAAGWGSTGVVVTTSDYPTIGDIRNACVVNAGGKFPDFPTRALPGFNELNDWATVITSPYLPGGLWSTQIAFVWQGIYRNYMFIRSNDGNAWGTWERIATNRGLSPVSSSNDYQTSQKNWNNFQNESAQFGGQGLKFRQFDDGNGRGYWSPLDATGAKIDFYGVASFYGCGLFSVQKVTTKKGEAFRTRYGEDPATPFDLWHYNHTSANTTIDTNGFIKSASPIVKIFSKGDYETNDESNGTTVKKVGVGEYLVEGCTGLNADAAWGGIDGGFEIPKDRNGQPLIWLDYEVNADGSVLVKTYHRTHPNAPAFARNLIGDKDKNGSIINETVKNGDPVDIPVDQFISIRVEMPVDNQRE